MGLDDTVRRCAQMARINHRHVVACLLIALCACGVPGPEIRIWTEEVQLSDGRVAMLERQERYHTTQELGGLGELHTDSSRLSLKLDGALLPTLTAAEMPLIFDAEPDGTFFVITVVDHCSRAGELGLDARQPYFEYRLNEREWRKAPVTPQKTGWPANLLLLRSIATDGSTISLEQKRLQDANPRIGHYYRKVVTNVC